jgi:hypothetical protein
VRNSFPPGLRPPLLMAATPDADVGEEEILSYKPLGENSAVSANPHIPSVTASAVLGESESVRKS